MNSEHLLTIAEHSSDALILWDRDLSPLYISPAIENLTGYQPDEFAQLASDLESILSIFETDSRTVMLNEYQRLRQGRDLSSRLCEVGIRTRDGRTVWIETSFNYILNKDGSFQLLTASRDITGRHHSHEQLAASEQNFRMLAENTSDVIWSVDLNFNNTYVSPSIKNLTGYTQEEWRKIQIFDVLSDESRETASQTIVAMMEMEERGLHEPDKSIWLELEYRHKDGHMIWVDLRASFIRDQAGNPLGYHGITRDVTQRKLSQKELQQSEERYRVLTENSSDVIWAMDMQLNFTYISPSCHQATGYRPEELCHRPPQQVFTEQALLTIRQAYKRKLDLERQQQNIPGISSTVELEFITKDKRTIWIESNVTFIRDAHGLPVEIHGISRDISAKTLAAERLRNSEERYRILTENSSDVIWSMDLNFNNTYVSPAVSKLLDQTPQQHMAIPYKQRFTPESWQVLEATICHEFELEDRGLSESERSVAIEVQHLKADGTPVWVDIRASFIRDAEGKPVGIHGITRNIEEQKATALELKSAKERAEKLARSAEQANRAKSEFLARMSHEIRTPINGIIGMNSLMQTTELNKRQRLYADTIRISADSLMTIINDILDFAKIESGKMTIEEISFNLLEKLDSINDAMAIRAQQKGLDYICIIRPEVPENLIGDPVRLHQVLNNLIGNAIKFTDEGQVRLTIAIRGGMLHFEIMDSGIGIPLDKQSDIFQAFTQADISTTRQYGGSGLGLSITQNIVELWHGQIGLESSLDKGSSFWFSMPLKTAQQPDIAPPTQDRVAILISNPDQAEALTCLLQRWQTPHQVCHGQQCQSDILITDRLDGCCSGSFRIGISPLINTQPPAEMDIMLSAPVKPADLYRALQRNDQSAPPSRPRPRERLDSRKILLVEDNLINQEVALGMLEYLGYECDLAPNGLEATAMFAENSYSLILMDIQMPVLDGFEATRRIRAISRQVPIIAMTAHALKSDRQTCLEAGMDGYITKPVQPQELEQLLAQHLGAPQAGAINYTELLERMGDATLCQKVLDVFVANMPQQLEQLEQHIRQSESQLAQREAHSIKGAAANVGAHQMRALAQEIERALELDKLPEARQLIKQLKEHFGVISDQLRTPVKHGPRPAKN